MSLRFVEALERLASERPTAALVEDALDSILLGAWNPTQVAAFITALRILGETPDLVAAGARAYRRHMIPVEHREPKLLDTCGTGGDALGSVNLSTGAAILASAAGARVAKHGNRAASSKAGSADVFASLGVRLDLNPTEEAELLAREGLVFLFAQTHHPALRHVAPARKELGVRTMFNCLGPLANPARATHQLIGAYDDAVRGSMASALLEVGITRAWIVRGEDGLDEVSPTGTTKVTEVADGRVREFSVSPEDFGLPRTSLADIAGGTPDENAAILLRVLDGGEHPARPAFVLNAAAALVVYDDSPFRDATARIERVIEDGSARRKLEALKIGSKER